MTDETDAYRGERRTGGQLVFDQEGNTLDKATDVVDIHSGGFDWGESADDGKLLQLAVALLNDRLGEDFAKKYHHGFAAYLDETLDGDEWELTPSEIGSQNYDRPTQFTNRCDDFSDHRRAESETGDQTREGMCDEPVTDGGVKSTTDESEASSEQPSGASEKERIEAATQAAVDDALEAGSAKPIDTILQTEETPPDSVVKELRAEIGKRAVSERVSRDELRDAAFDELERRFKEPPTPKDGAGSEFEWLDQDELTTTSA
jgi:hypothetical protein